MDLLEVLKIVSDLRDESDREMQQSILKNSNSDGLIAYGKKAAVESLERRLCARAGVPTPFRATGVRMK